MSNVKEKKKRKNFKKLVENKLKMSEKYSITINLKYSWMDFLEIYDALVVVQHYNFTSDYN